jgi:2-polyprenyl-6-methoxyphenol hydroxylase-like FAD-dependent oxidoreductase
MSSRTARKGSHVGQQAVVIGAGISGLAAARALADHFDKVVVLESDQLPAFATSRPGVPQGKQVHGLLGGAIKALEDLFPDFAQELTQVGAVRVNPGSEILQEMPGMDRFPLARWDWCIYTLTRPLIEQTLRRRVERHDNISLRGGCRALDILGISDELLVTGVRHETGNGVEILPADLVVDASRHGGLTMSFLEAVGLPAPEETTIGVDIRYGTALYALPENALGQFKAIVTFPKAPDGVHSAYLLPVENNCYQLLLVGRGNDAPPADGDAFLAYARELPTTSIYNAMKGAKRLSEVARYGFPESKLRHFAQLDSFPQNLLPIGDAICCLNPIYGQGITVAVLEANILRNLLSTGTADDHPLAMIARRFLTKAEALVKEPWAMSAVPDFIYPQTRGERPADLEQRLNSQFALTRIATRDPAVWKLMSEVRHLLKPLAALEEPGLVRRVKEEMETFNEQNTEIISAR